jgi:hypothetical protein
MERQRTRQTIFLILSIERHAGRNAPKYTRFLAPNRQINPHLYFMRRGSCHAALDSTPGWSASICRPMLLHRLRKRLAAEARFIEPCLPSPAEKPPSGSNWIHEIKHDGFRLMARRDPVGIRLITRRGNDWTTRYPLVVEAVNALKIRSCLIDGEAVCCDETGLAVFQKLRQRREEHRAFLFAFDLLELDDADLRRESIEETDATPYARKLGQRVRQFTDASQNINNKNRKWGIIITIHSHIRRRPPLEISTSAPDPTIGAR